MIFCKKYPAEIDFHKKLPAGNDKKSRSRKHEMSDSEIIAIPMLYYFGSFKNFKSFYSFYIGQHLQAKFPKQLSYVSGKCSKECPALFLFVILFQQPVFVIVAIKNNFLYKRPYESQSVSVELNRRGKDGYRPDE